MRCDPCKRGCQEGIKNSGMFFSFGRTSLLRLGKGVSLKEYDYPVELTNQQECVVDRALPRFLIRVCAFGHKMAIARLPLPDPKLSLSWLTLACGGELFIFWVGGGVVGASSFAARDYPCLEKDKSSRKSKSS